MTPNPAQTPTTAGQEESARAVVNGIREAWAAGDADAFTAAYTEDASLILSGDRFLRGRTEIRQEIATRFGSTLRGTRVRQDVVDLRLLNPDTVVVITEGGILVPGETAPAPERALRATWVITKDDGRWLIAAYQNTRHEDPRPDGR